MIVCLVNLLQHYRLLNHPVKVKIFHALVMQQSILVVYITSATA